MLYIYCSERDIIKKNLDTVHCVHKKRIFFQVSQPCIVKDTFCGHTLHVCVVKIGAEIVHACEGDITHDYRHLASPGEWPRL